MKAPKSHGRTFLSLAAIGHHFSSSKRRYALGICIIISVAFAVLFSTRVRSINYTLDLTAARFTATVASSVTSASFEMPAGFLISRVDGITKLKDNGVEVVSEGPISVAFDPPQAALPALDLNGASTLSVEVHIAQGGTITLRPPATRSATLRLVSTQGSVLVSGRNGVKRTIASSETPVVLDGEISPLAGAATAYLTPTKPQSSCKADDDPSFADPNVQQLAVDDVRFSRTTESVQLTTSSTIIDGTLRFPTLDKTIPIERGDVIDLVNKKAELTFVRVLPCAVTLQVKGLARQIRTGGSDAIKDRRPTYLEVAAENKGLGLVLSVLASLWGFFWGLRELVLKSDSE